MSADEARAEAEQRYGNYVPPHGAMLESGFVAGAQWQATRPFTEEDVEAAADAVAALKSHPMYGGPSAEEIARAALAAVTARHKEKKP